MRWSRLDHPVLGTRLQLSNQPASTRKPKAQGILTFRSPVGTSAGHPGLFSRLVVFPGGEPPPVGSNLLPATFPGHPADISQTASTARGIHQRRGWGAGGGRSGGAARSACDRPGLWSAAKYLPRRVCPHRSAPIGTRPPASVSGWCLQPALARSVQVGVGFSPARGRIGHGPVQCQSFPAHKTDVGRRTAAQRRGIQRLPLTAGAQHEEDGVEHLPVVGARVGGSPADGLLGTWTW